LQEFQGKVISVRELILNGEYLVNYGKGDAIRVAMATLHQPSWESADEAGQVWYIIRICGNLAVVRAPHVEVPAECVAQPNPVVTAVGHRLSAYACPSETRAVVAELTNGWHGVALACTSGCDWLHVQCPRVVSGCWVRREWLQTWGDLTRLFVVPSSDVVYVPAGRFQMGCGESNPNEDCRGDGLPLYTVYPDAYYIDKYEVTNTRFRRCPSDSRASHPAWPAKISAPVPKTSASPRRELGRTLSRAVEGAIRHRGHNLAPHHAQPGELRSASGARRPSLPTASPCPFTPDRRPLRCGCATGPRAGVVIDKHTRSDVRQCVHWMASRGQCFPCGMPIPYPCRSMPLRP